MGFEKSYQIKIPSKQLIKFSTSSIINNNNYKFNPYFVTGFCDAEACFNITVNKNKNLKTN
jgi:hypothetical protein